MLKPNDRISINGTEVTIVSRFASGKHVQFRLSDGRVLLDLDSNPGVVRINPIRLITPKEALDMECPLPPESDFQEDESNAEENTTDTDC